MTNETTTLASVVGRRDRVAFVKSHARNRARRDFEDVFLLKRPSEINWSLMEQHAFGTYVGDPVASEIRHAGKNGMMDDSLYAHYVRAYAIATIDAANETTGRTFCPPKKTNANPFRQILQFREHMIDALKEAIRYRAEVA